MSARDLCPGKALTSMRNRKHIRRNKARILRSTGVSRRPVALMRWRVAGDEALGQS